MHFFLLTALFSLEICFSLTNQICFISCYYNCFFSLYPLRLVGYIFLVVNFNLVLQAMKEEIHMKLLNLRFNIRASIL
jgi:hypothetical protein